MPIRPTVVTVKLEVPTDTYSLGQINNAVTQMLTSLKDGGWGIKGWGVTK